MIVNSGEILECEDKLWVRAEDYTYLRAAYEALATRLESAEKLLHDADAVIEILRGDQQHILSGDLLAAIEQHWQTYPEPLE